MLPTATSPGEAHRDMGSEKQGEKERQIKSEKENGRQTYSAKKNKEGAKTARLRRMRVREEQNNGCGIHPSKGCRLGVGE